MNEKDLKKQRRMLDRELRRAGKVRILVTRTQLRRLKTQIKTREHYEDHH